MNKKGFSLVELMVVVAIIAFLAMVAVPSFTKFLSKAKRAEAYMNLGSIYTGQKAYWAENGRYTSVLSGRDGIGWQPEGYTGGGLKEKFYYTYGFAEGSEGQNYFTGKLNAPSSALRSAKADQNGFVASAAADIDGDGGYDVLTVDQSNNLKLEQDDLA